MSIWKSDGETFNTDVKNERIAHGTVGGQQMVGSTIRSKSINHILLCFDPAIQYAGGAAGGTWTLALGAAALYRYSSYTRCSTPGAQVQVIFSGNSIAIFGKVGPAGGKFDIQIDGQAVNGIALTQTFIPAIIPAGQQIPPNSNQIVPLNETTTTITVSDTSAFTSTGTIRIDNEEITYTSTDATNFIGCTRGANGTNATTHQEGSVVYLLNSTVDTYGSFTQYNQRLWSTDKLSEGPHTLVLQIRSDKNASSTDYEITINSFAVGSVLGSTSLNLRTGQTSYGSITTNGSGKYLSAWPTMASNEQLVGVLGLFATQSGLTHQVDSSGALWFQGANSTTYDNVVLTGMYLGPNV